MITLLLVTLLTTLPPSDTLHTQWVRYCKTFFATHPGILTLTDQSVQFAADKKPKERNFTLAYPDIYRIRRGWSLIFPNMTVIRTRDGGRYRIYTYRRKKIIRLVGIRINRKK